MDSSTAVQKLRGMLGIVIFLISFFSRDFSASEAITYNFGDSGQLGCLLQDQSGISWLKNGKKLQQNAKIKLHETLYFFCLESSDSGVYTCMNDKNESISQEIIVKNPENREYVLISNGNKCVSTIIGLVIVPCNVNDCQQKWVWSNNRELISGNEHTKCLSVQQRSVGEKVVLETCNSSSFFQNWECKDSELLSIQGRNLYLSEENNPQPLDLELSSSNGSENRWVNFLTGGNLCMQERRVTVDPDHLVLPIGGHGKVTCVGINFINPSYTWLRNGLEFRHSDVSLYAPSHVLYIPFAYRVSAGDYTCVVTGDSMAKANATTRIEVFEDPSILSHRLDQAVNIGRDVCLSCQMYTTNISDKISWYKDGTLISPGNPRFVTNTTQRNKFNKISTRLCIKSARLDDGGEYACEVKPSSAKGRLQIHVKPKAYVIKLGGNLICNASGFPLPQLILYKDGKPVKNNENGEKFVTIEENGGNYTCIASNSRGTSSDSYISVVPVKSKRDDDQSLGIIVGCVVGAIILCVIIIALICCYCRRKKQPFNNNDDSVYQDVRYTATPGQTVSPERPARTRIEFHPRSNTEPGQQKGFSLKAKYHSMKPRSKGEWEIPVECIQLDEKLGEGQFGQVWKGRTLSRKGSKTVAIKMLKEDAELKDRRALIDELEFMKTMIPHPNIVGLVGCCTRSETVMIVVEFVPNGNLKDYLLRSRGQSQEIYANLAPYSTSLTSKDLMTFAYEIARGMSYLERIKCVHRDLAARNILIGDEKTCKIADFGLARDIYSENYYRKTSGGRLPLRWMAYESIFNGITTSQSDVWSFGILLWEIITLGGNPYPKMSRDELIEALQRGYRMPKPHHCSDEVYSIMWECWQQNPDKRPSFAELTASFLRLISLQQVFIDMENFGKDEYVNVGSYEHGYDN